MPSDASDPKIVERLKKFPPYDETDKEVESEDSNTEVSQEEPETPEVPETPEEPQEPVEQVEETPEEVKEEVKSRTTEQFDKLVSKNKELKEEVVKRQNILDSLIPPTPPIETPQWPASPTTNVAPPAQQFPGLSQKEVTETFKGLVDENGYVDTGLLISTLNDLKEQNRLAQERAQKAEQQTQVQGRQFDDFQRNQIMRDVHKEYPTLDPENENFDEKLWKYVRNEVVDQWMNARPTDVMAAAKEGVETLYGATMKKAEKEKIEQAETAKKNINALSANQPVKRDESAMEELRQNIRKGTKGALGTYLRESGN